MTQFVEPSAVRGYLGITQPTRNYTDGNLGSNIRAASSFLQRATGRQFEPQPGVTKKFTTNGAPYVNVPDFRTASSVSLQGSALTGDSTYWAIPDRNNSGVFTGIQFRAFGRAYDYRSNPQWWDRNLDRDVQRYGYDSSLPNDLAITADWGHLPYPEELLHVTKILSGFYAKRPDSVLANVQVTPEGAILNFGNLPGEVQDFISAWRVGSQVTSV